MSCQFGVKITQPNGSFAFTAAGNVFQFTCGVPRTDLAYQAGRLTAITYNTTVVAAVPAATGANALYEVGFMNNMGTVDAIATNRP